MNELESQPDPDESASLRNILVQTALITALLFGVVVLLATVFAEPTKALADWMVQTLGLSGIFLGVFAADAFTFPIPPDTYLLIAVASETGVVEVLSTICLASILAGITAYFVGPFLTKFPYLGHKIEHFRPRGEALFRRFGVWAVAIAALTPVPFSIVCWMAGIYNMPKGKFLATLLFRIPRFIGYFYIFVLGWSPV